MSHENVSPNELLPEPLLFPEWPGSYYLGEEEIAALSQVVLARSPFRYYGHDLQRFADRTEEAFRARLGRRHAILTNSGSAALTVAMAAAEIGPGDEVLVPAYCWVACFSAIVRAGAIPRLVEIDNTYTIDPADLERKIGPHSRAVLLVHMNGACGDVERVRAICDERGLLLIEDVAQAVGGTFRGKPLGSFGELAIFSFQYNKNMTAGEGGLVVCDDESLFGRAWAAHDQGYTRNASGIVDKQSGCATWGQGSRVSEITAAMLWTQQQKLNQITAAMRARSQQLYAGLAQIPGLTPRFRPDPAGDSGPFVLFSWPTVEICEAVTRRAIEAGVRSGPRGGSHGRLTTTGLHIYYENYSLVQKIGINRTGRPWTDPLNEFARAYVYEKGTMPATDDLIERSVILGVAPTLTVERCNRVIEIYREIAAQLGL